MDEITIEQLKALLDGRGTCGEFWDPAGLEPATLVIRSHILKQIKR
jgi:hypothetical protein